MQMITVFKLGGLSLYLLAVGFLAAACSARSSGNSPGTLGPQMRQSSEMAIA